MQITLTPEEVLEACAFWLQEKHKISVNNPQVLSSAKVTPIRGCDSVTVTFSQCTSTFTPTSHLSNTPR